jgi:hypothetical protein
MDTDYDLTDREFSFLISTVDGVTDINPAPPPSGGMLAHGHARIRKRGNGKRRITWLCTSDFSIQFEPFASDADSDPDSPGDIWDSAPLPAHQVGNQFAFSIDLRRGAKNETVAYKYSVFFGSTKVVDPVIIIDR